MGKRSWLLAHENATNFEASYDEALLKQQEMNSDEGEEEAAKDATGWETSFGYLKKQLESLGPIDGILGFSQGAAITGLYCAAMREEGGLLEHVKFVILCSGYKSRAHSHVFGEDLNHQPPSGCKEEEGASNKQYIRI